MYKGKEQNSKITGKKPIALLVSLVLLLTVAVGGTLAYLVDITDKKENTFTPTSVPNEVTEDFDGNVKKDVAIKNTGDIDAYIRAMVVFTWQDDDGNVYGVKPVKDKDYEIDWIMQGWVKGSDGYYYYNNKVVPNASTGELFTDCKPVLGTAPEGYHLSVEVMGQSIQAEGKTEAGVPAVTDAWGIAVNDDGTLKVN